MTISQIIALMFFIISVAILIVVIKTDIFKPAIFKKFFIGTAGVYVSGTLLVLVIDFIQKLMPWSFTIASEISIIVVFIFSMYMIHRMGENMQAITEEIEKRKQQKEDINEENS